MVTTRPAVAADREFIELMLVEAACWRPDAERRPAGEVLADPAVGHYVKGWPRPGDVGVIAESGALSIGAAWWRFLPDDDPGYGFVASDVPEISIGVVADHRGRGVGRALMEHLLAAARRDGIGRLSLSVETDNIAAVALYRRLGFVVVDEAPGAVTMVVRTG